MFRIGVSELLLILLILLLLFGAKRLPEIGRALGKTLKEFRKATQDLEKEDIEEKDNESS
jgi:sec-independent protein translocase protein TatA